MSIESVTGAFSQKEDDLLTDEFPVMGHHWDNAYGSLVELVSKKDTLSLNVACQMLTESIIHEAFRYRELLADPYNDDSVHAAAKFRQLCGFAPDDDSLPGTKYSDVVGRDEKGYKRAMEEHFMNFLTDPDSKPVTIGPILDGICRHCAFGGGNGGMHCQGPVVSSLPNHERERKGEIRKTQEFLEEVDSFFGIPPRSELMIRYPESIQVTTGSGTTNRRTYLPGSKEREAIVAVHVSLGLFRDVLAHKATRDTAVPFTSFNAMIQARGMSAPKQLS